MNGKPRSNLFGAFRLTGVLPGLVLLTALVFFTFKPKDALQNSTSDRQPTFQVPSATSTPEATVNWKNFSDKRRNIDFSFKYPHDWGDPSYYCKAAPDPKNLELSPGCLKTVIFTDQIDQLSNDYGRDLVLLSESQLKVSGFDATRRVYATPDSSVPDTYELWVYDSAASPFFVYVAWIGADTDQKTAEGFVQILDKEVRTLQLRRH